MASFGFGAIQWHSFDWQSLSTLITGFTAVAGAVHVGRKQANVSLLQANILERQVDLEEAKMRAELFQRRLETYEATADFVINISSLEEDDPKASERIARFNVKMRESEFLFRNENVYKKLREYWEYGNEARVHKARCRAIFNDGGKVDPDALSRLSGYPAWGLKEANTLAELFRHDLTILPT